MFCLQLAIEPSPTLAVSRCCPFNQADAGDKNKDKMLLEVQQYYQYRTTGDVYNGPSFWGLLGRVQHVVFFLPVLAFLESRFTLRYQYNSNTIPIQ